MKIFVNDHELNFELENEKNCFDIVNSVAEYSSSQSPQQFVTSIFVDGKEFSFADDTGLKSIDLNSVKNIHIETSDVFGISILSLSQMEKFLKVIESIINASVWNNDFIKIIDSMSWMKDGIEQIVSIFKTEKNNLLTEKLDFLDSFDKLNDMLRGLKSDNYPLKPDLFKNSSILINRMNDNLISIKKFLLEVGDNSTEVILKDINNILNEIENIIPKLTNVPILFQTGQDKEAMEVIQFLTKILENSITLFVMFKENLKLYLDKYTVKEVSFEEFFTTLTEHLKELMNAIENKDSVMIGDLLEYEFIPNIEEIKSILTKIKNEAFVNPN
ncbi:MAG TPA: hypothetical protein PK771_04160 [Spirochaetota bacterium]|nr:hypothetical protein [Spirochaetota bacterium]